MKDVERIKQDVVNQLAWDNRLDASNVNVKVDNGTVVLTGNVPTFSAKIAAEDITWGVVGVSSVDNQLNVAFPTTYTVPTDEEIRSNIIQQLDWNPTVDDAKITVAVEGGLVTLEGSVTSFWEKSQAESEAKTTGGVIDVINKLAVVPTEDISDEIIGERIMDRIEQNTVVDVDNIDVKAENGRASLNGAVPNWNTWRSVYDAAQYTSGVTEVVDNLTITYA